MTQPQLPNISAPIPVETLGYYTPIAVPTAAPAYRTGKILVLSPGVVLPDRCVKCNQPTDRRFRRSVTWYPWYLFFALFVPPGGLILLVLYLIFKKTMRVDLGVCPRHLKLRRTLIALAFLTLLGAIYALVYTVGHEAMFAFILFGLLTALSAAIASFARILRPTRMDNQHGYFQGASPEFLNTLPGIANPPR
jgi:hypothetical protein